MTPKTAANIAIGFTLLGWFLYFYGVVSQLGDPAPTVTNEQIKHMHWLGDLFIAAGFLCLAPALWLAGYSFSLVPKRSILLIIAVLIPITLAMIGRFS